MANICGTSLFIALFLAILNTSASEGQQSKIIQKRNWIIPAHKLMENKNYMDKEYVAKIRSDEETKTRIYYSLTGSGADQPPVDLFIVDKNTGLVKIRGVLDREKTPVYYLRGVATFLDGGKAETDIDLKIVVEDENDNAPVFNLTTGAVYERRERDTFAVKITATDADQEETLHSKIAYSIVKQDPEDMFYIDRETGGIYVMHDTLDREKHDTYTLVIKGTDMNGAVNGNTGTGTAIIKILDVNDNIPTLKENSHEYSVEENTRNVEVVRIPVEDDDLSPENRLAVFTIESGNEAGYFSISTDNKTNEGILILNKELDYEELKEIHIEVSVANLAEYHPSVKTERQMYIIHIRVINQPEGPRFKPAVKVITISEESSSITLKEVITNYAAIDSDTLLPAKNVKYAKGQDVDNWLNINELTGDIKLNKIPDYESKFLINGTYYAKIICITNDSPSKTATGTIAIQVKDFNDHCPVLSHQSQTLCYEDHVVYVTAVDEDQFPNSSPFVFNITTKEWNIEPLNDTTVIFRSPQTLWPGVYHVFVDVKDQQGKICAGQELQVNVCMCDATKVCLPRKNVSTFGASGVLLMLLGLLLLLLVPLLLLFCLCGGVEAVGDFKTIPFETKDYLICYNTEGQGEDMAMAHLQMSRQLGKRKYSQVDAVGGAWMWGGVKDGGFGAENSHGSSFCQYDQHESAHYHHRNQTDGQYMFGQRKDEHSRFEDYTFDGLALSDAFLGNYYSQKASHLAKKQDKRDYLKVYDYEGQESFKGSFEDICDLLHEDNDFSFLDDINLKFKTLAEICSGSTIKAEISTSVPVTSKPVLTTTHEDVSVQRTIINSQSQEKAKLSSIIHTAGAQQTSSMSSAGVYVQEKVVVPNQTLLAQQPGMYYTHTTPIYVVDAQRTMLVTPSPVLGHQENMLVEERKGSGASQHGNATRETQHYQSVVMFEKQPTKGSMQTQSSVSGAAQIVNTEIMQSTESHDFRRSIHPSRGIMTGAVRETDVLASLDMRVPQRL
ncbi:desmoglein-2-like protein isoform X2 [Carassius carassius]|uniref:desmoglein-2-like protein isoform X2 n=1 Tax=Carassius carassius TaxID=217509 RepID=UPI00286960B4|nr:desmoglein-2-like protein isoform X2 [Carassius carassius]